MTGKCIDFASKAVYRWGSELILVIIVCLLISWIAPSIDLMIFGSNPYDISNKIEEITQINSPERVKIRQEMAFERVFAEGIMYLTHTISSPSLTPPLFP